MKQILNSLLLSIPLLLTSVAHASHSGSYAPIIKKVTPSVVTVSTSKKTHINNMVIPGFPGLQFPGLQLPEMQMPEVQQNALGSGVVIDDGYILTNHHVIDGADEILVSTQTEKDIKAEIIGSDERTDLAADRKMVLA